MIFIIPKPPLLKIENDNFFEQVQAMALVSFVRSFQQQTNFAYLLSPSFGAPKGFNLLSQVIWDCTFRKCKATKPQLVISGWDDTSNNLPKG